MNKNPLTASELFHEHLLAFVSCCLYIGFFVISIPVVYLMDLARTTELFLFAILFALCHLANWPMFRIRWRLWFQGRLTPYAAMTTTALLAGSFGIPFILLVDMIS
jgi:hypothetical protein